MRILVVAATQLEIPALQSHLRNGHHIEVLVTGVGMVATAARCARALALSHFDLAFNFGVCGSFDASIEPGAVVHVTTDCVSELGAEDGERFVPIQELGLGDESHIVNTSPPANAVLSSLRCVKGVTVNTVHGDTASIALVVSRFAPQVESMEGAAFAFACTVSSVPYAQVRAVSNVVERRNRDAWRMDLAVRNLNDTAMRILEQA